jgi:hypothetical protein
MRKRRLLTAVAGAAITACLIAGTAWGATAGWQDVWNQIRPLLSDPGTVNNADNPVHWTKLKGVPAGFADGLDNGVDKAGFGLTKNLFPEVNLAVDTARIQRRVTGACGAGQAIQSIGADGSTTCDTDAVYHGWNEKGGNLYANLTTIGGVLEIPAGSWSIVAAVTVSQGSDVGAGCVLEARAGGRVSELDGRATSVDSPESSAGQVAIPLIGVHASETAWRAAVRCNASERPSYWHEFRITAMQVGEIHITRLGS